ncbi:hypothetical protein [Dictyobacter halimunensis]|uniref:hypothetical protein n=1 Tax=Dictyobacter halimunensis TaxID=3026934 RepID=UPI0030C6AE31
MKRSEIHLIYYMACMFLFFMPGFILLITNPMGPLSRMASTMMFLGLLALSWEPLHSTPSATDNNAPGSVTFCNLNVTMTNEARKFIHLITVFNPALI